jgi:hypothetical protein
MPPSAEDLPFRKGKRRGKREKEKKAKVPWTVSRCLPMNFLHRSLRSRLKRVIINTNKTVQLDWRLRTFGLAFGPKGRGIPCSVADRVPQH